MGDAIRRKKLGFGKFKEQSTIEPSFTARLVGEIEDSFAPVRLTNSETSSTLTVQFHFYRVGKMLYAEFACYGKDWEKYRWIGENIDKISPIVCEKAVKDPSFKVAQIDLLKLCPT
jgi:hypothetical protein